MPTYPAAAFVDSEAAVRAWANLQTDLVGAGHPVPNGFHLTHLRATTKGVYGVLTLIGSNDEPDSEAVISWARISASFYGGKRETNALAAKCYANTVRTLQGAPQVISVTRDGALLADPFKLWLGSAISGPLYHPDGVQDAYLVDATFGLSPAP